MPLDFSISDLQTSPDTELEKVLLDMGVKPSHVRIAMRRADDTGETLTTIMRDFGFLSPEQVAEAISKYTQLEYFSPADMDEFDPSRVAGLSVPLFKGFIPLGNDNEGKFCILVPDAAQASEAGKEYYDKPNPRILVASENTIQSMYRKYFAHTEEVFDKAVSEFISVIEAKSKEEDPALVRDIFCALIRHTCYSGASDLYIFKSEQVGIIKLKINGVGTIFRSVPEIVYDRIMNKLITENSKAEELARGPQEGVVSFENAEDKEKMKDILNRYGFRLELAQTRNQKTAVIRILDKQSAATELPKLGFDKDTYSRIARWASSATGLIIVTGPTGSGKTTTLYAILKSIDPVERSIQSIENPMEYRHGLWMQYETRKDADDEGQEFNEWLKALLRNAPDVILMGEVRDAEVAAILLDAANTGHLVFTTLHTNNAALALARLKRLKVDMDSLASVLLGVLAQRLVRVLCPKCKQKDDRMETEVAMSVPYVDSNAPVYRAGDGCPHCDGTGYKGRKMIYESLDVTRKIRELIENNATPSEIVEKGIDHDKSLWACGVKLMAQGITSLEEIRRVALSDDKD